MTWLSTSRSWQNGPWSFDVRGDEIADITYSGRPVLRSVRAVVRDRNWDTADLVVDRVRDSGTTLTLHVRSQGLGSSFRGIVRVEARHSRLIVLADLESERDFATNRTGLVVLHPPQLAGEALRVTHTDRTVEESVFPAQISPHQPVFDIAQLSWLRAGSEVSVAFDGDVFEMEDQRNWSDASFKTYSRPLAMPFPYSIPAGTRVQQRVLIDVRDVAVANEAAEADVVHLELGGPVFELGLGAATAPDPDPAPERGEVTPASVLVELDLRTSNWQAALDRAAASGAPLDIRVIASAGAPWDEVITSLAPFADSPGVVRVGVFDSSRHVTDAAVLNALRTAQRAAGVHVPIVAGSRAHFTELNREWDITPPEVDGVTFSTTPLFHSLSTEQLIESVAIQRTIARQAVRLADGRPVHVGPITLRPRFNSVATEPPPAHADTDLTHGYGAELSGEDDQRQSSPELAAWTVASAAAVAVDGVASITFFEEWGPRGVRDARGEPFPVSEAVAALLSLRVPGALTLSGSSPDGLVWAIGARLSDRETVLVASLDRITRTITVTSDRSAAVVSVSPGSFRTIDLEPVSAN
ncbi:hypothetical protein [Microbacterium sp.]|uniref:hypothetical protein n=1 Tax=Microbacterium sp. TaxID=51671 RepID=UPI003A9593FD